MNDMQNTARELFDIAEKHSFIQVPSVLDERGYCNLFGEDPETKYQVKHGKSEITFHALFCYSNHISFSLDGDVSCNLIPQEDGYLLQIIDVGAEESIIENHINTREDLINAILGFQSVSRTQEADEE